MTTCFVYLWTFVNYFSVPTSLPTNNYNPYFVHNVHGDLTQVFINLRVFTIEKVSNFIISRHCFWCQVLVEMLSKISRKSVWMFIVLYFLSKILGVFSCSLYEDVLIVSQINLDTLFARRFLKYKTFSTFISIVTCTFYFGRGVKIKVSI